MLAMYLGRRLKKSLRYLRGPRVLEVSFGTGYLMQRYAGRFQTTGVDYSPHYVEATRHQLEALGLKATLIEADAHDLPFAEGSFDSILNTDAFTLYENPTQAMAEFYRVLAPGGRLILMEYDYPNDRNILGTYLTNRFRRSAQYVDFKTLLTQTGFSYEDHHVGSFGMCHMYIATKPD